MDARDFFFITDKLNDLTSLDLSQVTIAPFERNTALYGTVTKYDANELDYDVESKTGGVVVFSLSTGS